MCKELDIVPRSEIEIIRKHLVTGLTNIKRRFARFIFCKNSSHQNFKYLKKVC